MYQHRQSEKKYDLRWRFDYLNHPTKKGKWSSPGNSPELQAWRQNKENLTRAGIEGQDVETQQIVVLAECDGHDFVNFQWEAVAIFQDGSLRSGKAIHALSGLKILTRENEISVNSRGQVVTRPRTDNEKKINFATFGR